MEEIPVVLEDNGNQDILRKENVILLVCSLLLGILFDVLFYEKLIGVSYPIFVLAFYFIFLWNARKMIRFKFNMGWLLSIPILMLSLTYLIFSNTIFKVLNFLAIPILIAVQTTLITNNNKHKWYRAEFVGDILYSMFGRTFGNISKPFILLSKLMDKRAGARRFAVIGRVLIGLIISVPLVFVIVLLLSSADQVFKSFIDQITSMFTNIDISSFIFQSAVVFVISVVIFGYIYSLLKPKESSSSGLTQNPKHLKRMWDPITIITILFAINIIYCIFTFIQFSYLFGNMMNDLTYAEYARRGFFELNVVTLINLSILLSNINLTKREGLVTYNIIRILNSLLIICTMVMLVSAHFRMSLYEQVYGYTYLRILTHAFMVFILILLIATLCKVWYEKIALLKVYIIVAIIAYTTINFINIDDIIAHKNIQRYKDPKNTEVQKIDISYLTYLSYDAVPEMIQLIDDKNEGVAIEIRNCLYQKKQALLKKQSWQSFNISEYRAKKILEKYDLSYKAKTQANGISRR